jgi:hypothetical protein
MASGIMGLRLFCHRGFFQEMIAMRLSSSLGASLVLFSAASLASAQHRLIT